MRPPAPVEARAYEQALTRAAATRLLFRHPLDTVLGFASLWVEPDSLRAKLAEAYPHALDPGARIGLGFVPVATPYFPVRAYRIAPITDPAAPARPIPTVVIVLPTDTIAAARRDPHPFAAILRVEAPRLRDWHVQTGVPMPPALAALFAEGGPDPDGAEPA
jgi:hypothetical protein